MGESVIKSGETNAPRGVLARAASKAPVVATLRSATAKIISALVLLTACHSSQPASAPSPRSGTAVGATGSLDPRGAVLAFLSAVHDQDLQRIAAVWGTKDGSVQSSGMAREELERRELVMLCYLRHDRAKVVSDAPSANNHRVFGVEITRAGLTRETKFYAVQGPQGHWYVENVDIEPLQELVKRDRCQH